jgi:hypothetical protein
MLILIKNFKLALYAIVFYCFSLAHAGTYDDFFQALKADDARMVNRILQRGFDPNTLNPMGVHPLFLAIKTPSPAVIDTLLKAKGLRVEHRNAADESPLMIAAIAGMADICERLIKLDADVNKPGWAPLHYAASGGHAEVVRLLLAHSAYIDALSPNKTTPLMMAAMYGNSEVVELLITEGADLRLKNDKGLSALDFAEAGGREASAKVIASYLLEQPGQNERHCSAITGGYCWK